VRIQGHRIVGRHGTTSYFICITINVSKNSPTSHKATSILGFRRLLKSLVVSILLELEASSKKSIDSIKLESTAVQRRYKLEECFDLKLLESLHADIREAPKYELYC